MTAVPDARLPFSPAPNSTRLSEVLITKDTNREGGSNDSHKQIQVRSDGVAPVVELFAIAQVASAASPVPATSNQKASFQVLGQMPGLAIQPGQCGTTASGISGDGNVIVGAGCVSSV